MSFPREVTSAEDERTVRDHRLQEETDCQGGESAGAANGETLPQDLEIRG